MRSIRTSLHVESIGGENNMSPDQTRSLIDFFLVTTDKYALLLASMESVLELIAKLSHCEPCKHVFGINVLFCFHCAMWQ